MNMRVIFSIFLLAASAMLAQPSAKDVADALAKDIAAAKASLTACLENIGKQKIAIAAQTDKLKQDAQQQKQNILQIENQQANNTTLLEEAQAELGRWQNTAAQVNTLLEDFAKNINTANREGLLTIPNTNTENITAFLAALHQDSVERLAGSQAPGKALSWDGQSMDGLFLRFGPVLFFQSNDKLTAGPAAVKLGSTMPTAASHNLSKQQKENLAELFAGKLSTPPTDISAGQGIGLLAEQETFWQHFKNGGPVMFPIAALAIFCLFLSLVKVCQLIFLPGGQAITTIATIASLASDGKKDEAMALANSLRHPLKSLAKTALKSLGLSRDDMEDKLYEDTLSTLPKLERFLSVLAVSASAAPLLGLLGTVTGMIHTFKLITVFGTGDARLLSSGISEALITTEAGLVVAIPALLVHAWCTRRTRRASALCQEAAICLVNSLGQDNTQDQQCRKTQQTS